MTRRRPSIRKILLWGVLALVAVVVVLNWTYGRLPVTPHPKGSFLQLAGLRLRYLERPGPEPAVLLIHGLPGTAEDFEDVTPLLAGHRTIAIDRPGYGFSTGGYFSFDRQLQAVHEVIERLHLGHPILVGHSYGGAISLGYAERYPHAVRGLVLVDAAATCTHNAAFARDQARFVKFIELPVISQLADVTFSQLLRTASADPVESEAFSPNPVNQRHHQRVLAINLKHGNLEAYAGETIAANGVIEGVNRGLRGIHVPAVVVQGAQDKLVKPECGRRLAASLPDARLQMVQGGHMVPYTHPATVAAAVGALTPQPSRRARKRVALKAPRDTTAGRSGGSRSLGLSAATLKNGNTVLAVEPTTFVSYAALALSLIAIGVTFYTYRIRRRDDAYQYLADIWNAIVDAALEYPRFLNAGVTIHYEIAMSEEERYRYDAYCYKTWGLIEDMVVKCFHDDPQFKAILEWTVAYHLRWIQLNPQFFNLDEFWEAIECAQESPQLLIQYQPVPAVNGDINWDVVSRDYHRYILGPFAPEMVAPDELGRVRNSLVVDLMENGRYGSLEGAHVADFGCGPGNLIPHLPPSIGSLVGVDLSQAALDLAAEAAADRGIRFEPCHQDLCNLSTESQFDLIISVNAILPRTRAQVVEILEGIRRHLRPGGRLLAILPSYDTTQYARELWRDFYTRHDGQRHAERVIRALMGSKLADDASCSYAEDGRTSQCYHTPETIDREFARAGLAIESRSKIYYPWELVRRFDYGYFPAAPEEIWDWYVVASPADSGEQAS